MEKIRTIEFVFSQQQLKDFISQQFEGKQMVRGTEFGEQFYLDGSQFFCGIGNIISATADEHHVRITAASPTPAEHLEWAEKQVR